MICNRKDGSQKTRWGLEQRQFSCTPWSSYKGYVLLHGTSTGIHQLCSHWKSSSFVPCSLGISFQRVTYPAAEGISPWEILRQKKIHQACIITIILTRWKYIPGRMFLSIHLHLIGPQVTGSRSDFLQYDLCECIIQFEMNIHEFGTNRKKIFK